MNQKSKWVRISLAAGLFVLTFISSASAEPFLGSLNGLVQPKRLSVLLEALLVLTFISFVPTLLVMSTSFLRIVVVLSFLRQALGTQQTPPSNILIGLAIILTLFLMGPTLKEVNASSIQPYMNKKISWDQAAEKGAGPIREFMLRQTRKKDLGLAMKLARLKKVKSTSELSFPVLATAFAISELKTAFIIGFIVFIPFVLIDMVVASVLMSLGMMMVPPTVISLPLKILLFVLMDGWNLLIKGLVESVR